MKHLKFKRISSPSTGFRRGKAKVNDLTKFGEYYNELIQTPKDIYTSYANIPNEIDYISNIFTTKLYIKHRSTTISEIRYLTNVFTKYDDIIHCVYIGDQDIRHLYYNSMLFPGVKFIIFGSSEFKGLNQLKYKNINYIYLKCKTSTETKDNIITYLNNKIISDDAKSVASTNTTYITSINDDIINCILSTGYNFYIFEEEISLQSIDKLKILGNIYMIHNKMLDKVDNESIFFNRYQYIIQMCIHILLNPIKSLLLMDASTDNFEYNQIINNAINRGYHLVDIYDEGYKIINGNIITNAGYNLPVNSTIYLKPYSNPVSLTTNIEIDGIISDWYLLDVTKYTKRMSYHNLYTRVFKSFINPYVNFKIGYDNSYDCAYETQTYIDYLIIRPDVKFIGKIFKKSLTLLEVDNDNTVSINLPENEVDKIHINTPYFKHHIHGFIDDDLTPLEYNDMYRRYYEVKL